MITLFCGYHIGVPQGILGSINLRKIFGREYLKLRKTHRLQTWRSDFFIKLPYLPNGFRIIFSLRDSASQEFQINSKKQEWWAPGTEAIMRRNNKIEPTKHQYKNMTCREDYSKIIFDLLKVNVKLHFRHKYEASCHDIICHPIHWSSPTKFSKSHRIWK